MATVDVDTINAYSAGLSAQVDWLEVMGEHGHEHEHEHGTFLRDNAYHTVAR